MRKTTFLLLILLLTSCQSMGEPISQDQLPPVTLPPIWTSTATFTALPPSSPTATITPTITRTPYPASFENSTWLIKIDGPPRWYSAEWLVELSDGAILAMGPVYGEQGRQTVWLARLTRAGQVTWLRTIPLPGNQRFTPHSLDAGPDGQGLVSGTHHYKDESGSSVRDHLFISIMQDGQVAWKAGYYSDSTELAEDGSMLLFSGLGARKLSPSRQLAWQAILDFGEAFLIEPMFFPMPEVLQGHGSPEGELLFGGTTQDLVVPGDMIARAGPDPGYITYWYAAFDPDGELRWKHFYAVDPLQQHRMRSAVTADGNLVIGGTRYSRVVSQTDLYFDFQYAWLRVVDPDGRTIFHQRYLDLPRLEGIGSTPDGGLILHGLRYVPGDEINPSQEYAQLVKLDAEGRVEWAREFQEGLQIEAVLALRDGTYLLSIGNNQVFVRLNAQGWLPDCEDIPIAEKRIRVDNEPAQSDTSAQVPLSLTFEHPEEEPTDHILGLSSSTFSVQEFCRYISP